MQASGGATALMYACQQCRESEVSEILRKQPHSVKDRDRTLKTPLHYCAENPNTSCAEAILKVAPELVNAQDENGYCPLHLAVIAGNKPLIKLLITKGADVNIHDNERHSAVHWAIVSSEKEALEMIIRAGANPSTSDVHGGYPLHYAVQMCGSNCDYFRSFEDTVRVVESLLNVGVDVNVKDKDGRQPILWAASAGSADAVIHLISSGACVEAADKDGLTALHCAASRGHTTTLETLITLCGANVDVIDGNGCSALFYSVTLGHADATDLLLELGAEPNRQDRKGRTPAHCGAAKGQLETLKILQKHGGNLWMRNVKGDIPLHEAVASGRKDLVIWLLSQNSEAVNLANNDGRCPLHIASMYNNTEMVKVLLDSKSLVNPVMRTSKGVLMTPLNVALCKGHRSCGKYLQLHGGVPFSKVSKAEPTSVFALRVSPSDDIALSSESRKENAMSSQSKISKSRSSSDIQGNQEIIKMETGDKKKFYRRRKKKKSQSNVNTQDSDSGSDENIHESKVKTSDNQKSEKSNMGDANGDENDEDEEKILQKVQKEAKGIKKEKPQKNSIGSRKTRSSVKQNISEEGVFVKKATKVKTESKPLHKNKSFNETKNVSDLSPEDFPPQMQTINQLDSVIMEPDVDVSRPESENNESLPQDVPGEEATTDDATVQLKKKEEVVEKVDVEVKFTSDEGLPNVENNAEDEKTTKHDEKEISEICQEKSNKIVDVKKPIGKNQKDEMSPKTPESKTSNDEASVRKSVNSTKSLSNENSNEKEPKKSKESLEEDDILRKTVNDVKESVEVAAVISEKQSDSEISNKYEEEKVVSSRVKNTDEVIENEKKELKTTQEATSEEKPPEGVQEPETKNCAEEIKVAQNDTIEKTLNSTHLNKDSEADNIESIEKEAETKPEVEEVKPVTQNEICLVATGRDKGRSFSPEERVINGIKTPGVAEEPAEEPAVEPPEVFQSETAFKNSTEKNNPEDSSVDVTKGSDNENSARKTTESGKKQKEGSQALAMQFTNNEGNAEGKSEHGVLEDEEEEPMNKTEASAEEEEKEEKGENESPRKKSNGLDQRHFKTPKVSRLCRRHKEFKEDMNQISVTQLVQNTIRKYHMERGIFYQLLELKRYQIKSGKANEQVLVKRLADEYERSRVFLGMKPFSGLYKFKEFEKFLYDQLKALNTRRSFFIPEVKSYDDIDALSGFLKKSRYKIISEVPQPEMVCTCITQRCHHSACAYTSVPCSAYITDLRRHRHHRPKRESFFPRIEQPPSYKSEPQKFTERPATLELIQGSEKHVITLPQNSPARGKRYYVTFTIKGAPAFKEEDFAEKSKDYFKHRHAKSV